MQKFAGVHRSTHGDGQGVVGRLLATCEEMLVDRGCTNIVRGSTLAPALVSDQVDVYLTEEKVGVKLARQILEGGKSAIVVSPRGHALYASPAGGKPISFSWRATWSSTWPSTIWCPSTRGDRKRSQGKPAQDPDVDPVVQWYGWPVGTVVRVWRCFGGHSRFPTFASCRRETFFVPLRQSAK